MSVTSKNTPEIYTRKYLLSPFLEGYAEFQKGELSIVKSRQLEMLALKHNTTLLEIGYGRGELLYHCAKRGAKVAGIDFSPDAYKITKETLREFPDADIRIAQCTNLPFENDSFERVFAGDVIEHLGYDSQLLTLREMYRVLRPGGFMLIHTTPNTVFIKFVYPLLKHIIKLLDRDTVLRLDEHRKNSGRVHIYEHNLFSLKKLAKRGGFVNAKTWIDPDILRSGKHRHTATLGKNPLVKFIGNCGRFSVIRFLLGNDIYLKCHKKA